MLRRELTRRGGAPPPPPPSPSPILPLSSPNGGPPPPPPPLPNPNCFRLPPKSEAPVRSGRGSAARTLPMRPPSQQQPDGGTRADPHGRRLRHGGARPEPHVVDIEPEGFVARDEEA